jgi:protein-disulfide isomerase
MTRKTRRNQSSAGHNAAQGQQAPASRITGRVVFIATAVVVLMAAVAGTLLYRSETTPSATPGATVDLQALASDHSPTLGEANARVHVVEFLDPACETCALFFPIVKQYIAENPGQIRLSIRHVALHTGSEYPIRLLEASRAQGMYWQTLEALLASQARWAPQHTVQPHLVREAVAGVGLDAARLEADMNSPEVTQRVARDRSDAMALKVTATPEYFVNGRPLPSFGEQQLRNAITMALQSAD